MENNNQNIQKSLEDMVQSIECVDTICQLVDPYSLSACASNLTSMENTKLDVALAYTLLSLIYTLQRLAGSEVDTVQNDLNRLKGNFDELSSNTLIIT